MSKMKWRKEDIQEFAKLRKNFNAKINRLSMKYGDEILPFLPQKLAKEDIITRDDFNKIKKYGKMFTERGSDKKVKFGSVEVPKYFRDQTKYMEKSVNARLRWEKAQFTEKKGTKSKSHEAKYTPIQTKSEHSLYDLLKNRDRLESKFTSKQLQKMDEQYKENYINTLKDKLGSLADPIIELIKDLDADLFASTIYQDYEISIDFLYDFVDAVLKAQSVYNEWEKFLTKAYGKKNLPTEKIKKAREFYNNPEKYVTAAEIADLDAANEPYEQMLTAKGKKAKQAELARIRRARAKDKKAELMRKANLGGMK